MKNRRGSEYEDCRESERAKETLSLSSAGVE